MEKKLFKDINIDQEFIYEDKVFIKIIPEKISCCKSHVARLKDNPQQKLIISPNTSVFIQGDNDQ